MWVKSSDKKNSTLRAQFSFSFIFIVLSLLPYPIWFPPPGKNQDGIKSSTNIGSFTFPSPHNGHPTAMLEFTEQSLLSICGKTPNQLQWQQGPNPKIQQNWPKRVRSWASVNMWDNIVLMNCPLNSTGEQTSVLHQSNGQDVNHWDESPCEEGTMRRYKHTQEQDVKFTSVSTPTPGQLRCCPLPRKQQASIPISSCGTQTVLQAQTLEVIQYRSSQAKWLSTFTGK